jgi:hypothetical protein
MPRPDVNSVAPVELAKNGIKLQIPWRFIVPIVGFLLCGGTLAGVGAMFSTGSVEASPAFESFRSMQERQHIDIDGTLKRQDQHALEQDSKIENIKNVVSSVQTTQQRDVARNEARRLTEKIKDRIERENTYDRIYELNLRRLQRGLDPCGTIACE